MSFKSLLNLLNLDYQILYITINLNEMVKHFSNINNGSIYMNLMLHNVDSFTGDGIDKYFQSQ
jgi:hypothetical protein